MLLQIRINIGKFIMCSALLIMMDWLELL